MESTSTVCQCNQLPRKEPTLPSFVSYLMVYFTSRCSLLQLTGNQYKFVAFVNTTLLSESDSDLNKSWLVIIQFDLINGNFRTKAYHLDYVLADKESTDTFLLLQTGNWCDINTRRSGKVTKINTWPPHLRLNERYNYIKLNGAILILTWYNIKYILKILKTNLKGYLWQLEGK